MILQGDANVKMSLDEVSWIIALMHFGNILSPVPSGLMSDCLGRKNTLLLTAFLFLASWLLTIFGTSFWTLALARVVAGVCKGVAFTVVPMYLGEIAGVKVRGAISTIFTGLFGAGILFEYCIGIFVSYNNLNIISSVIPVIFFVTFFMVPESPYFLSMTNHQKEARDSLAWFRNADQNDEKFLNELSEINKTVHRDMYEKTNFVDLVTKPRNRRALIIVVCLFAFKSFGGHPSIAAFTVVTLPKTGGYFDPETYMIIFGTISVVGNFLGTPLIDRWGRKPLLILSCSMCALLTGVSAAFYWMAGPRNDLGSYNWIPYITLVFFGISYSIGIGMIPSTFVGELFPTNVKSRAAPIAAISYAIASFLTNKIYLVVKETYGVEYMFGLFTLSSIISVFFTILFVFETKGKTFREIDSILSQNVLLT